MKKLNACLIIIVVIIIIMILNACTIKMYTDVYITVEDMDVNIETLDEDEIIELFDPEDLF